LSQALLEFGALLAYQPERPALAKTVFKTFLRRFPDHPSGDLALRNLAQLELDDSNYAEAIAHLKRLAKQYPNSAYKESAQFLLERTAQSLTAQSRSRRAPLEYVELLIPDNPATALFVAVTMIPLLIRTFMTWHKEPTRLNSVLFAVVIACALLISFFNYVEKSRDEARLSADIAALTHW
jgi:tetratricopeptide (TPR) repeat protein